MVYVAYSDVPLYFYFINSEGTVRKKYTIKQLDNVWAKQERFKFFRKHNYPQMAQYALKEYLNVAAIAYSRTLKELHDKCTAQKVKLAFLRVYLQNLGNVHLNKKEKFIIFECFNPSVVNIYYLAKVISKKIINFKNMFIRR